MSTIRWTIGLSVSGLALAMSGPAFAQAAGAPADTQTSDAAVKDQAPDQAIADIVVTAQRRAESLQKTPLTIQVLETKELANAGVTTPSQLSAIVPSVQIGTSGPATSVYVRGVGGFQTNAATSPAVPYYLDGIYVARTQSVTSEMYDIERLEVVKGPQGTLYGRNASGGAINVLSVRPELDQFAGHAEAEFGNYDNRSFEAAINIPIGSTVALRASGTIVDKGGFTSEGFGDDKHQSARLKLLWEPGRDFSLLLNGSYGHIGGEAAAVVARNRNIPGWYPWMDVSDPRVTAFVAANGIAPPPFVRNSQPTDAGQNLNFYNVSAQLDWQIGGAKLTVIPAYRRSEMQYSPLLGFTYYNGGSLGAIPARPETSDASSVEARLSGESGRLTWLAGLFFFNEDQYQQYAIDGGFVQNLGNIARYKTTSYAAFTQNTFELLPSVRLIVGARYTSDERKLLDGQSYVISPSAFIGGAPPSAAACAFPAPTQPQCLVDTYQGRKVFTNFSWKIGFEADVFDNSLFYATASRGFKAGGFNVQSAAGTPGQALLYQPEVLTSYETGLKSRFLDNKLQLNVSAFYWDYKNHQEPVLTYTNVPGLTNLIYQNAGAAEIYGGTVDIIAKPWRGATLNASAEFAKSRYIAYSVSVPTFSYSPAGNGCRVAASNPATTTLDCSGFEVARTPKWSGNLGFNQDFALGKGTLTANANLSFSSSRWLGVDFIPLSRANAYGKVDASLTYRAPQDRFSITGFVRNITDAKIYTDGLKEPFSPLFYGNIQPPRTYGVRLGANF